MWHYLEKITWQIYKPVAKTHWLFMELHRRVQLKAERVALAKMANDSQKLGLYDYYPDDN